MAGACLVSRTLETPGHQVPRLAHGGEIAAFQARRGDGGVAQIISGEEIDWQLRPLRHIRGVQPVAGDLKPGPEAVQRLDIVPHITPKLRAIEIEELLPARILTGLRQVAHARGVPKSLRGTF